MSYEVIQDVFGVRCIYTGHCLYADVQAALIAVNATPSHKVLTYCIHDFTKVESIERGIAPLVTIGAHVLGSSDVALNLHTAVVCTDESIALLCKSFSSQARRPTQVFSRIEDAEAWILTLFS